MILTNIVSTHRLNMGSTGLTTSDWIELVDSLPHNIRGMELFNPSGATLLMATGGIGAASPFGGAGAGQSNAVGKSAIANTGSGGGGGGTTNATGIGGGTGGGAGGFVDAIITSPSSTYKYSVGGGGTHGNGGTGGNNGGDGAAGIIEVTEYYQ